MDKIALSCVASAFADPVPDIQDRRVALLFIIINHGLVAAVNCNV